MALTPKQRQISLTACNVGADYGFDTVIRFPDNFDDEGGPQIVKLVEVTGAFESREITINPRQSEEQWISQINYAITRAAEQQVFKSALA